MLMSSALMYQIRLPSRHILKNQFPYEKYQIKLDNSRQFSRNHCSASEMDHIEQERMPKHIAITPDGHRRWAKSRNLPVEYGYEALRKGTKRLAIKCSQLGIHVLTVLFFTTNNWNRPQEEVDIFMTMTENMLRLDFPELISEYDIQIDVIGDKSRLPKSLQSAIVDIEVSSKGNSGMHLLIADGYGGRNDVVQATQSIARKVKDGVYEVDDIDDALLDQHLHTGCIEIYKSPDLCIRTGGETRSSDFLLYQIAYSEMYYSNKFFPDYNDEDLLEAIRAYQKRDRRFGGKKFEQKY